MKASKIKQLELEGEALISKEPIAQSHGKFENKRVFIGDNAFRNGRT